MDIPESDDHELNQLRWWSYWSRPIWFSKQCYALLSRDFEEPLFNHAEFLDPKAYGRDLLRVIEAKFLDEGHSPSTFLPVMEEYRAVEGALSANGYKVHDQLSIMEITSPSFDGNPEVISQIIGEGEVGRWCEAYLLSFYEETDLLVPTFEVVKRAFRDGSTKLILAMYDGVPAGSLALYETEKICSAYCVGTLPRYRRMGVASTMLKFAHELSREVGKRLALQTFLSDSLEKFYIARGFKRIYLKEALVK